MNDREWQMQELEAMKRLALSGAERARWDSLDAKGLMPSRVARKLAGLKHLARTQDPFSEYEIDASPAFRAPFDAGEEEREAAAEESKPAEEPGIRPLRRKRKERLRLFRR
ncbi:MAG: hypothetical protein ACOC91_01290 [bacterium]